MRKCEYNPGDLKEFYVGQNKLLVFFTHTLCTPASHRCTCSYPCLFCRMSSSDTAGSDTDRVVLEAKETEAKAPDKKGKKRPAVRGKFMTPEKRTRQFVGMMDVRGETMWCLACECPVGHHEKSTAMSHIRSQKHVKNAEKKLQKKSLCTLKNIFFTLFQKKVFLMKTN